VTQLAVDLNGDRVRALVVVGSPLMAVVAAGGTGKDLPEIAALQEHSDPRHSQAAVEQLIPAYRAALDPRQVMPMHPQSVPNRPYSPPGLIHSHTCATLTS
jgi:hypothetical protein